MSDETIWHPQAPPYQQLAMAGPSQQAKCPEPHAPTTGARCSAQQVQSHHCLNALRCVGMVMHVRKHTVQIDDVNHEPHKDRGNYAVSLALTTDSLS